MRIGQVNQDNYKEMLKLFGGNNSKSLDNLLGKDEKNKYEKTEDEEIAMLIKQGYIMEGMYFKEGDVSWKKIIPVSDEIKNKILDLAKSEFTNNNGMTDGEELSSLKPPQKRYGGKSARRRTCFHQCWRQSQLQKNPSNGNETKDDISPHHRSG